MDFILASKNHALLSEWLIDGDVRIVRYAPDKDARKESTTNLYKLTLENFKLIFIHVFVFSFTRRPLSSEIFSAPNCFTTT